LGMDTPYKGPNKWFGGGRLRGRDSSASQISSGNHKTNQNVLFGIATPQLPVWATDSPSNSKPSKSGQPQQLKHWPDREVPLHMTRTSGVKGSAAARNQLYGDPPDDEGDDDGDDKGDHHSRSNRNRRGARPSGWRTSSTISSRRGPSGGGGDDPPSEPSDGGYTNFESNLEDSDEESNQKGRAIIPYGKIKPTIKAEIKQEQLPRWDGNPNTAVKYFLQIQQLTCPQQSSVQCGNQVPHHYQQHGNQTTNGDFQSLFVIIVCVIQDTTTMNNWQRRGEQHNTPPPLLFSHKNQGPCHHP